MTRIIRLAEEADANALLEIYGPFCRNSPITFETSCPTVSEIQRRIRTVSEICPWLVCEHLGNILGYAYASRHRDREAYRWSVDVAVYLSVSHRGQRIGTALYTALFDLLRIQGFYNVYAGITLPNPASIRLHERFGFERIGIYRNVGYKAGAWHDVGWWGLQLRQAVASPAELIPLKDAILREDFLAAIKSAEYLLQE